MAAAAVAAESQGDWRRRRPPCSFSFLPFIIYYVFVPCSHFDWLIREENERGLGTGIVGIPLTAAAAAAVRD